VCAHPIPGKLSDAILLDPALLAEELSTRLLAVKGIGPWSANMYQMFSLQIPDVFPVGDLGIRTGVAKAFGLKGSGKNGAWAHDFP
jgi:3-methyladenine DNA glycosylase/8-oxoguanine DNA glycosylase